MSSQALAGIQLLDSQFLVAAGISWFVVTSLQSLPPRSIVSSSSISYVLLNLFSKGIGDSI